MSFLSRMFKGDADSSRSPSGARASAPAHQPSEEIAFLGESMRATSDEGEEAGVNDLISLGAELFQQGNIANSVRCLNAVLDKEHTAAQEIAARRSSIVALASFLGLGTPNLRPRDFDYCYVMEHINKHMDAVLGLYATHEEELLGRNDAEFFRDCYNMAASNYQSIIIGYMAYEQNGEHHMYQNRLPDEWDIAFVSDPKNALRVNGRIYPHLLLLK